ncbi:MAG: M1 family metallopeptidase [Anaerolineae bacterium]
MTNIQRQGAAVAVALLLTLSACARLPGPTTPVALQPTLSPTQPPATATVAPPTAAPTLAPTTAPTAAPTQAPTRAPGSTPASAATIAPAAAAVQQPTTPMIKGAQGDLAQLGALPRYTLDLTVDPFNETYKGRQKVVYTNTDKTPLTDMVFRVFPNSCPLYGCGALNVDSVRVDGAAVTSKSELDNTAIRFALPKAVPPGGKVEVDMDFSGRIAKDFGPNQQGYGINNYDDGKQIMMLANAYPIVAVRDNGRWVADAVYADGDAVFSPSALYDVTLHVPGGWNPVATGVATTESGTDTQRSVHYTTGPVRDFMIAIAPGWQKVSRQVGDTVINSYYAGDTRAGAEKALDVAAEAFQVYSKRIGPYPFTELNIVPAPLHRAAGVEYPGLILVERNFYDKPAEPFFETATAHEVAHQWFYSVVGNDVINNPWLDESFAQYLTALYFEDRYGQDRYNREIQSWQRTVDQMVQKGQDDIVGGGLPHFKGNDRYAVTIYIKGPLFLDALRQRVGDDKFFAGLQEYYRRNKYGIATPEGFLKVMQEVSGQNLQDLYDHWITKAEGR